VEHPCLDFQPERTHEAVADRLWRRPRYPGAHEATVFGEIGFALDRVRIENVEQQIPPARQEQGAIVILNREHVFGLENIPREQAVTDLPGPRAEIVSTVADDGEGAGIGHARIRGPDATAVRIDDARVVFAGKPAHPAMRRTPVSRQHRIKS